MNMNFYIPTRLITGKGCVQSAGKEFHSFGSSCLIVTGKNSAKACGAFDDVVSALDNEGISWILFDGIGQNPLITDCIRAAQIATSHKVDFIIGIGGGSPLDAAKCTAVFAANPDMSIEELYQLNWPNKPLPIVAVGTTAGTGSEVTKVSVVTTPEGRKKSFHHEFIYPALALGDYTYTKTLPDSFTCSTAADAFAHCMESYFNRNANEISKAYAIRGMSILLKEFIYMISHGVSSMKDENRENCYNASIYGGLAIAITGTAFPHTIGYLLTEQYQIPHGTACAVFLPEFYFYNKEIMPELTNHFLQELNCTETELLSLLTKITPACHISMTESEIENSHDRWINNGSLKKCWGDFSPSHAKAVLSKLFTASHML